MQLNVTPTSLSNISTTFFEIKSKTQVNILGNLGIGTDRPLTNFHIENIPFDDKIIQIPTASNIYNYRAQTKIYSLVPTGSIIIYPISSSIYLTPLEKLGWYECNGQTLLSSKYPVLSDVMAGQFGNTNPVGQYITLPDFQDKVGIGSTRVGYISPADPVQYASPSNLYSNTIIDTINPSYTIQLTYNNLPPHNHYANQTGDPIAGRDSNTGSNLSGAHSHTYSRAEYTSDYQGTPGYSIRTPGLSSWWTANNSTASGSHVHTGSFYTLENGKSCTPNLTNGTFTEGGTLAAASISIRQPSITMIYLMKCL